MMWRFATGALLALIGAALVGVASARAAGGDLDPTFSGDGKVRTPIGGSDQAAALAIDAQRRIILGGSSTTDLNEDFALARYLPDGSLDTSFSGDGKLTTDFGGSVDRAFALAIDSQGRIVLGGESAGDFALARYLPDGSLDTSFSGDGKLTTDFGGRDFADELAIDSQGRIVLGGSSSNGSNLDFALARYNPDGSLDTSFSNDGKLTTAIGTSDIAGALAIDSQGRIVLGGHSSTDPEFPYSYDFALARYNPDGSLDTSFSGDGKLRTAIAGTHELGSSLALDTQGRIVLGGASGVDDADWPLRFALARYLPDGSLDTSFSGDGTLTTPIASGDGSIAWSVAIDSQGRIVLGGESAGDFALARYDPDGSLDTSFSGDGKLTTDFGGSVDRAFALAIDSQGRIVLGGESAGDFALARYIADGPDAIADGPDATAPQLFLGGSAVQRLRRAVRVKASCDETCEVGAIGRVVVQFRAKPRTALRAAKRRLRVRLKPASASLAAREKETLRLGLSKRKLKKVKRAMKAPRAKARAKLKVSATDGAGNQTTKKRTVRLRRR